MLAAVVVNHGDSSPLVSCVTALVSIPAVHLIIVVHNSPPDLRWRSWIEENRSSKLVEMYPGENVGYAAGNNLGLREAASRGIEYVLVCNPDVVVNPAAVEAMLAVVGSGRLSLVSPSLIQPDGLGRRSVRSNPGWDLRIGRDIELDSQQSVSPRPVVPLFFGACFLTSSRLFKNFGYLDETLFLYCEELELCARLGRISKSSKIGVIRDCPVEHGHGISINPAGTDPASRSELSLYHAARSAMIVGRRYWPFRVWLWAIARSGFALRMVAIGRLRGANAVVTGIFSGLGIQYTRRRRFL